MPGISGFRDNETGHARANVFTPPPALVNLVTIGSSHTSNFSTIGHSDPEIQRWGCTCARAEMSHPTHDLSKALT